MLELFIWNISVYMFDKTEILNYAYFSVQMIRFANLLAKY
jgi:hypothetical protein